MATWTTCSRRSPRQIAPSSWPWPPSSGFMGEARDSSHSGSARVSGANVAIPISAGGRGPMQRPSGEPLGSPGNQAALPMPIVGAAIDWAHVHLRGCDVPEPHLEAQLLLGHVLGCSRARVLAHPAAPVSGLDLAVFAALVGRRARREPHAYLTG